MLHSSLWMTVESRDCAFMFSNSAESSRTESAVVNPRGFHTLRVDTFITHRVRLNLSSTKWRCRPIWFALISGRLARLRRLSLSVPSVCRQMMAIKPPRKLYVLRAALQVAATHPQTDGLRGVMTSLGDAWLRRTHTRPAARSLSLHRSLSTKIQLEVSAANALNLTHSDLRCHLNAWAHTRSTHHPLQQQQHAVMTYMTDK